jgi:uncharacterized protein YggE
MIMRFIFSLIALALVVLPPANASALDKIVTVTGEASAAVAPDMALIRLGVTSRGKTAREASDANAKEMTALLAAITAAGVAERDIQTAQISLQPQMDNGGGSARLVGFQATNQLTVKMRDIDKMSGILDRAIAAGANEMSGIDFVVSERSKLLDQARSDAIADARRKAEVYARAAGVKLGRAVAITEEGSNPPIRPMAAMRAGGAVPIAPGEQTLRATVTVSYELLP